MHRGSFRREPLAREDHFDRSKQPSEQARRVLQRGSALLGQSRRQGRDKPSAQPGPRGPSTAIPAQRRGLPHPQPPRARSSPRRPGRPGLRRLQPTAPSPALRSTHRAPRGSSGCSGALGSPGPRSSLPPTPRPALTHPRVAPGHPASHGP